MPTFVSDARLELGALTVNIGAHQWGFTDGATYLGQEVATTPYGVVYGRKYNIKVRDREVRFVKSDALMEQLHRLHVAATMTGALVKFTPDVAVPGTFWWVVWPQSVTTESIVENRQEITLLLREQSPGA